MSVYPLTTPLDLRLSREIFMYRHLKWDHDHWTVGVVSLTRRRPGMRQVLRPVPAPANRVWKTLTHTVAHTDSRRTCGSDPLTSAPTSAIDFANTSGSY
ncbi:hypothetical protein EVAR_46288_1 [Eumeta japonica]|uniref:Uncharacterized protein n=1 Tax=Eumeta variegata TaxID=151549 RepID=A0A4C1Y148_EUMVA|nr:hypothetical protein EVAR_46288_1 [Eumeta japonica]